MAVPAVALHQKRPPIGILRMQKKYSIFKISQNQRFMFRTTIMQNLHWELCKDSTKIEPRNVKMVKDTKGSIMHIFNEMQTPWSNLLPQGSVARHVLTKFEKDLWKTLSMKAFMVS